MIINKTKHQFWWYRWRQGSPPTFHPLNPFLSTGSGAVHPLSCEAPEKYRCCRNKFEYWSYLGQWVVNSQAVTDWFHSDLEGICNFIVDVIARILNWHKTLFFHHQGFIESEPCWSDRSEGWHQRKIFGRQLQSEQSDTKYVGWRSHKLIRIQCSKPGDDD